MVKKGGWSKNANKRFRCKTDWKIGRLKLGQYRARTLVDKADLTTLLLTLYESVNHYFHFGTVRCFRHSGPARSHAEGQV